MSASSQYFQRVLSPWVPGVQNPLPPRIDGLGGPDRLAVDVGCGPGVLTVYLAERFGRVLAVDRDAEMIEATRELVERLRGRGAGLGEVELVHGDWTACEAVRGATLVCAVNSVLETHGTKRRLMLELIRDALDPEGSFLGVFPSMEAQVHLFRLFAARLDSDGLDADAVRQQLRDELITAHSFDALEGTFASRDEPAQKFYYDLELSFELRDAGLEPIESERVLYPWEVCRQVDAGYFPGETELWDWFVRARAQRRGDGDEAGRA